MFNKKNSVSSLFDFLAQVEKLKSTLRYSKTTSGRKESTAEHSWRLALMTFMIAEEKELAIDVLHAVKIVLVHDIAEAVIGDMDAIKIAEGKISKKEKEKQEKEAMIALTRILPKTQREEVYTLWEEYENALTDEAKYVKALDKIETLTQLVESGYKTYDKPEFIANYADKAVSAYPALTDLLREIKVRLKEEFIQGDIEWKQEYGKIKR
ncbi:HD domain-containing protein [Patescibacteria group bacterium]|nr:HD domain-containing protein [Patescibacteria group bacterium]